MVLLIFHLFIDVNPFGAFAGDGPMNDGSSRRGPPNQGGNRGGVRDENRIFC
jgi:hypothetical protein